MRIRYTTSRDCDFGERKVEEDLATLVDRRGTLGQLVELLVEKGVLTVEEAFSEFKAPWDDGDLIDD